MQNQIVSFFLKMRSRERTIICGMFARIMDSDIFGRNTNIILFPTDPFYNEMIQRILFPVSPLCFPPLLNLFTSAKSSGLLKLQFGLL